MFCIVNVWNVSNALVHAKGLPAVVGKLVHGVASRPQQTHKITC